MQNRISNHIRSNIVGYIALFLFAIGGSAYAVDGPLPGQNQVGSSDIINGEVTGPDLGASSVSGAKILDGQVKAADLASAPLTHPRSPTARSRGWTSRRTPSPEPRSTSPRCRASRPVERRAATCRAVIRTRR